MPIYPAKCCLGRHEVHCLSIAVFLVFLGFCGVDSARSAPATQPDNGAGANVDVEAIKKTFQTVTTALINEDAAAAKKCVRVLKESDQSFIDASIDDAIASHHIGKVAEAKFGKDAKQFSRLAVQFDDDLRQQAKEMDAGTVRFDSSGKKAELETTGGKRTKDFIKTDDGWKIDNAVRFVSDEQRDKQKVILADEAQMRQQFATEIEKGTYKTADDAVAAFIALRKAFLNSHFSTTLPIK